MTVGGSLKRAPPDPIRGRIAVVGVCASGKTVLVEELRVRGYDARQCAQEHSYVPDMWQRLSRPEALVYLDASLPIMRRRRQSNYGEGYVERQRQRLAHARKHCDVHVDTDSLNGEQVLSKVMAALDMLGIAPFPEG